MSTPVANPNRGLLLSLGLFATSLLPALLAFPVGFFRAQWNLTDPLQQTYLTPLRTTVLLFILGAVFAPFVGAVVALLVVRLRGRTWSVAVRTAAGSAGALGVIAFFTVIMTSGGS